jgi:hypothetical protein
MSQDYVLVESTLPKGKSVTQGCAGFISDSAWSWQFANVDSICVACDTTPIRPLPSPDDWREFKRLVVEWRRERGSTSSIREMTSCPAYLRIISFGPKAIPMLLAELHCRPDFWFAALRAVTNTNPVDAAERGNVRAMANAWIRWGIENLYIEPINGNQ